MAGICAFNNKNRRTDKQRAGELPRYDVLPRQDRNESGTARPRRSNMWSGPRTWLLFSETSGSCWHERTRKWAESARERRVDRVPGAFKTMERDSHQPWTSARSHTAPVDPEPEAV